MTLRSHGFTLIELMIALAIFGFLLMLAGPQYAHFMADHQIRNASDAMLNGVQQAQSAAVSSNSQARLLLDPTTGTGGWQVFQTVDGAESTIQTYSVKDGSPQAAMATLPGGARQVTFDGFGRIVANADASATLTCIKVTHPSGTRPLNVAIGSTALGRGGTKLCDPNASAGQPQACPPGCS